MEPVPFLMLQEYASHAKAMDVDAFMKRHGNGFLLHQGDELQSPGGPRRTLAEIPALNAALIKPMGPGGDTPVFAIRKGPGAAIGNFISVGRTRNNDVVILDVSVTKFHAMFTQDGSGRFLLQDAGSRNGTWVDSIKVPTAAEGAPMPLRPGCEVRLGHVVLSFLDARGLHDLARRLR
jgi:hypothetical protein